MTPDPAREALRHTLATLAYRGGKAVADVPDGFADFRIGGSTRTPGEILAHIGDLLGWAHHLASGAERWPGEPPVPWSEQAARFFAELARLDALLASDAPLACTPEKLFQGPIADALTHVGQLTMLRRLAGAPVRGENYASSSTEPQTRDVSPRSRSVAPRPGALNPTPKCRAACWSTAGSR
jgi:hypothetical protein